MIKTLLVTTIIGLASVNTSRAYNTPSNYFMTFPSPEDSARLAELDLYWAELSRTVKEGDFEGYSAGYHDDAVIVFASGKNKVSFPIAKALSGWKEGFDNTKAGNAKDNVEFRFSQRIGDATTAHETGIFIFTSSDAEGNVKAKFVVHFEMLLVKRNGKWLAIMENQKSNATEEEWNALQ